MTDLSLVRAICAAWYGHPCPGYCNNGCLAPLRVAALWPQEAVVAPVGVDGPETPLTPRGEALARVRRILNGGEDPDITSDWIPVSASDLRLILGDDDV